MERLRFRSTGAIGIEVELRERALLAEVERRRVDPITRPVRATLLRMLFGRLRT